MASLYDFSLMIIFSVALCQVGGEDAGVRLSLNGICIANKSYVNIGDIGEDDKALLCHTDKSGCCRNDPNRLGEWHFPNGTSVDNKVTSGGEFYRNRGTQVVLLHHREGSFAGTSRGRFQCEIPDASDKVQTIYVYIVDNKTITMSLSALSTRIAGNRSSLVCTSMISFHPPLEDVMFEWFYGPNGNSSLPPGVIISATINISSTYTSTLEFSPLLPSHAGQYTCQLGGNQKLQETAEISVNNYTIIGFEQSSYTVMEGYIVTVCFNVTTQGTVNRVVMVNVSTADHSTMGSGDYTPTDMPLGINMSTEFMCMNISTVYDDNPMNMEEAFIVSLTSNDPKVSIPKESANTTVIIENILPPDVEPMINKVTRGMKAVFTVKFSSSIASNGFQWQRNGKNIEEHARMMNLTIVNAAEMDEGNYTCIVTFSSFEGSITSNTAQLLVFSPANITTHPHDQIVAQGGTAEFSVNASGDGLIYQWQKNGANIPDNHTRYEGVSMAELIINDAKVNDVGIYRCIVFNGAGDNVTSNEVILTVISPPTITNYSFELNSITIYWEQDDLATSYTIQYNFTIRECADEMARPDIKYELSGIMEKTNYTIHNGTNMQVEEDSKYNISLVAVISNVSSPATIISGTTKQTAPSGAPMSVTNISESSTSIHIAWEHVTCDQRNGKIDGYNVIYYPEGDSSDKTTATISDKNRTFVASGLQPLTNYTFEVLAFNGAGYGPAANGTFQTLVAEAPIDPTINATISYLQSNPIVGKPYSLSCLFNVSEGFMAHTTVLWIHPNRTNFNTSSIVFDALHASDSGKYTCRVTLTSPVLQGMPQEAITYNLTIQFPPPKVSISLPNTTLHAGSTVNITCNVILESKIDINVTLNVTWFQGSANTTNNTTLISPPYTSSFISILTLSPLSAADNNITCLASILPIREISQFLVESPIQSVSKILNITNPTINITISSSAQMANVEENFNITCTVHDLDSVDPILFSYQWTNDSKSDHSTISNYENRSTVAFPALQLSNAGKYECKVNVSSNYFVSGYAIGSNTYILSIKIPEPSSVKVSRSPEMIYAGSNFTLKCNITLSMNVEEVILESLEISVKWMHLGIGMIGSEVKKSASLMFNTSISINSANHSHNGTYTCDAKVRTINSSYLVTSSKTSEPVEITIIPAPSAPTIKKLLPLNSTSVNITWMIEDDINKVDNVTIQYIYAGPCTCPDQVMCQWNQLNETVTQSANYSIISDLQEYSTYLFKITAYNPAGPSGSNEKNVTTLSAVPTGAPQSLTIIATNLTSITVTWDEVQCIKRNSDITGYIIKFNGRSYTTNMSHQFIASQLFPSTTYTFQIAAMSINGTGSFESINASTSSPEDVQLLLNGQILPNNSIVAWADIGEGSASLMCLTNQLNCCRGVSDSGNWIFPNQMNVTSMSTPIHQLYRNSAILLQRQNESPLENGIFHCVIMDKNGEDHYLYVGIYQETQITVPKVTLTYTLTNDVDITFVLNCTSVGVPVSQMAWRVNGSPIEDSDPFPILVDAVEGHYFSTLSRETEGDYSCVVTNGLNVPSTADQSISILQQPTANSARAVQIIGKNSFQMCWDYPMSILQQGSYYHILNSDYVKVNQASYDKTNLSFSNDIFGQHSNINRSYVFLQVVPSATMQDLPSRPIRVDISAPGVTLHHMKSSINHGSVISIESIGEGDDALICRTMNRPCCQTGRRGEWYYPNQNNVLTMGANQRFYRNRSNYGEVILHQRQTHPSKNTPGLYCCVIPDKMVFCGIYQRICVNLASLATILPSQDETVTVIGEDLNLKCIAVVGSEIISAPIITWSGPNGAIMETSLPEGVMLENSNTADTYTSALNFIPLRASHKGNYTCQVQFQQNIESNSRYLDVTAPKIQIMITGSDKAEPIAGQSYNLICSVLGAENLDSSINYQWIKNDIIRQNSSTLSFSPLRLSDADVYICRVTVSSDYLDNALTANSSISLNISIPDPVSVLVETVGTQGKPLFLPSRNDINITLRCTVQIDPSVDVPVIVQTSWMGPERFSLTNYTALLNATNNYISMANVSRLKLKSAGVYHCTATVMLSTENQFITNIGTKRSNTTLALFSINPGKEVTDTVGDNANIQCEVNSERIMEEPMIFWSRERDSLRIINSSNLSFNQLMATDAVTYVCHASYGSVMGNESLTITANLDMEVEVHLSISNPVRAGDSVTVICSANINKTLINVNVDIDIHFTSPNQTSTNMTGASNTSLGLHQASIFFPSISARNSGQYQCNATIRSYDGGYFLNSASKEGDFFLILIPSRPVVNSNNLTIKEDSITFSWSQDPYDSVSYYQIDYSYTEGQCNYFLNVAINHTEVGDKKLELKDLEEYSTYEVRITAVNSQGNDSTNMIVTTLSSAPSGTPSNVSARALSSTSILIRWNEVECLQRNGIITDYNVQYRPDSYSVPMMTSKTMDTSLTVSNLIPSTNYTFQVAAESINGTGPSQKIRHRTDPVKNVVLFHNGSFLSNNSLINMDEIGAGAMSLLCFTNKLDCCGESPSHSGEWYFPNGSRVPLQNDGVIYRDRGASVVRLNWRSHPNPPIGVFRCQIPDMVKMQDIYVGVYPRNAGEPQIKSLYFNANQQSLTCTSANGPATQVIWERNGAILSLDENKYSQIQLINDTDESIYDSTLYIRDLNPADVAGNYSCTIINVRGSVKQGIEINDIRVTGHESAFPFGTTTAQLNCTTDLAVRTIEWLDAQGTVLKKGTDPLLELTTNPSDSLIYTCRIMGEFGNQTMNVTLTVLPEESEISSTATFGAAIATVLLAVLLVVVVIVSILIVRRKRHGKLMFPQRVKSKLRSTFVIHATPLHGVDKDDDDKLEMSIIGKSASIKYKGIVPVEQFDNHVKKMHSDRDQHFEDEYASISKEPQNSYAASEILVNKLRNRFGNIFPYDHCRVKLKEIAGCEHSDYINASYMDGYQKPGAYIAAQGPLPNTLDDFWRMIWENRLTTIVMLTQCFEGRKKCESYWPENINEIFEPGEGIKIVLTSTVPFSEYTIRKMTVTRGTEPDLQPLEVIQFHFIAWPDHGVPDNCAVMLNFIRRVRKLHPYSNPCPLLVHCSAGVGRTGTFIVLDTMLERMKEEDTLNIYDYVTKLRKQRVLMVQTLAQYVFIHDALKEYILCGQTEIIASDIRKVIEDLSEQHDPCSAATGFEHQFQILRQLHYVSEEDCYSNATTEHNIAKNRYSNKLPNNFFRVRLKSSGIPGSDYINASFIHGYRQKRTYIATQGPLESTVCDFWRTVWESESKCVVLLTQLNENDKEMCCCYWPTAEGHAETYGQISVKLLTEERYGYCDLRKFEIDEEKVAGVEGVKTAFTVTQFHFLEWPEHETPPITSSLIELMGNVNKIQMGAGIKPIIVMCNDGVGRTGTFICIHAQLERLKTEGVFDFFQFIKSARMQRAGLVSDSVQYVLCHEVLADYLESFDTYANFKEVM